MSSVREKRPSTTSDKTRRAVLDLLVALRAAGHAADEPSLALLAGLPVDEVRARVAELRSSDEAAVGLVSSGPDSGACARADVLWSEIAALTTEAARPLLVRVAELRDAGSLHESAVDGPAFGERGLTSLLVGRPVDAKSRAMREIRGSQLSTSCQTLWYCSIDKDFQLSAVPYGYEILSRPPAGGAKPWSIGHLIDAIEDDVDALREFDLACVASGSRFMKKHGKRRERFFLNVIPHTLLHEPSRRELERLLGKCRPGDLVLELSERFPADMAAMTVEASRLEAKGLWVAIDDWGVAGGDLDKLDAWSWTYVKIAGQFADISRRRSSRPVLEALVKAHSGFLVVEGVEPDWHEDFLVWYAAGARIFQCFLLSEPATTLKRKPRASELFRPQYLKQMWQTRAVADAPPTP